MDAHLFQRHNHQMSSMGYPNVGHHLINHHHQQQQQHQQQHRAHHQQNQQHQQHQQQHQRAHYSNRQQAVGPLHGQQQAVSQQPASNQQQQASSAGSSASDPDEHVQLSSLSTSTNKTSSSQQAMLHQAGAAAVPKAAQTLMHQQQRRAAAAAGHRQAALQAQTLGERRHKAAAVAAQDQLTTSSSDHTIDDLHQLARGYRQHRLDSGSGLGSGSSSGGRFLLGVLFTLAELLLFATVFLWLYWSYQHDDGLAWQNDRKQQFNTHAALMLLGFIFLSGQAMLIYRSFQCCSKIYTKILHTILFVLATSAISLGLMLAYTAQENVGANNKPIMHFYSLHAWTGLTTVALFVLQFVFGFVSFLILLCCDQSTARFRSALLPVHKTFGLIIFSLAVATSLMGLLQTARSRLSSKLNKVDYHELGESGIIINLIGVCLICLAILMPYIIRNLDIKRPFRSELDRHLKLSQLEMRI